MSIIIPNIEEYYESFRKFNQNQKMKKIKKKYVTRKLYLQKLQLQKCSVFIQYNIYIPKVKMLNMAKNKKLK